MGSFKFIFLCQVKPVVDRYILTGRFMIFLIGETISKYMDQTWQRSPADIYGKALTGTNNAFVSHDNILVRAKQQCPGQIIAYHIFVRKFFFAAVHRSLCPAEITNE